LDRNNRSINDAAIDHHLFSLFLHFKYSNTSLDEKDDKISTNGNNDHYRNKGKQNNICNNNSFIGHINITTYTIQNEFQKINAHEYMVLLIMHVTYKTKAYISNSELFENILHYKNRNNNNNNDNK